jgi:hypothetical protein
MIAMQQTDDDVLENQIAAMGAELGSLYHAISREVSWLHWRWHEYRVLFGEKPSRIDLMNESAPFFFQVVHDALFESTLLGIARLVGPPSSVGRPNLTIRRFDPLIADANLRAEVSELIESARTTSDFAIAWRNRHIAHRDLELALNGKAPVDPLPLATRENVETALAALRKVMGRIERAYCNSSSVDAPSPWGAQTLLRLVRGGLLRERDKRASWNRGERHADDMNPPGEI